MSFIDWSEVWEPSLNLAEVMLRGTVVYLFLFILLRVLRRGTGNIVISDLLLIVLIADAAQNAMGNYRSITEGIVLVLTITLWAYLLDYLGYKFPKFQRWLESPPLLLIKDGRFQLKNMKKEMITKNELLEQLREEGVIKLKNIKRCWLEGNGHISVIVKSTKNRSGSQDSD